MYIYINIYNMYIYINIYIICIYIYKYINVCVFKARIMYIKNLFGLAIFLWFY